MTLARASVNLDDREYAPSASYVALSRVRKFEDLMIYPCTYERLKKIGNSATHKRRIQEEDRHENMYIATKERWAARTSNMSAEEPLDQHEILIQRWVARMSKMPGHEAFNEQHDTYLMIAREDTSTGCHVCKTIVLTGMKIWICRRCYGYLVCDTCNGSTEMLTWLRKNVDHYLVCHRGQ